MTFLHSFFNDKICSGSCNWKSNRIHRYFHKKFLSMGTMIKVLKKTREGNIFLWLWSWKYNFLFLYKKHFRWVFIGITARNNCVYLYCYMHRNYESMSTSANSNWFFFLGGREVCILNVYNIASNTPLPTKKRHGLDPSIYCYPSDNFGNLHGFIFNCHSDNTVLEN